LEVEIALEFLMYIPVESGILSQEAATFQLPGESSNFQGKSDYVFVLVYLAFKTKNKKEKVGVAQEGTKIWNHTNSIIGFSIFRIIEGL
jgi:hypothetical protein